MPDYEDFEQYRLSTVSRMAFLAVLFLCVSFVVLSVYGATRLYYRSGDIAVVKGLNSKIAQQGLIIKSMNERLEIAESDTREARAEAQKLRRAHKWVGIFRSVLPKCVDADWNGEVKDESKSP